MKPISVAKTFTPTEVTSASVELLGKEKEFSVAKNTGMLQSAAMQTGEKSSSMAEATTQSARLTAVASPPSLRDYGTPNPKTRFAQHLDPVAKFNEVTDLGLPNGTATQWKEFETAKLNRPDPASYLDTEFMKEHLAMFDEGAVSFITTTSLRKYTAGYNKSEFHGRSDGLFVLPAKWAREMLKEVSGDPSVSRHPEGSRERKLALIGTIERRMGIPADFWSKMSDEENPTKDTKIRLHEDLFAVFIENPKKLNLRFSAGTEAGANMEWRPGGYTPAGIPEAFVDKVAAKDGLPIPIEGLEHVLSTWQEVHYSGKESTG